MEKNDDELILFEPIATNLQNLMSSRRNVERERKKLRHLVEGESGDSAYRIALN